MPRYIINPKTGRKVLANGVLGKKILAKKYNKKPKKTILMKHFDNPRKVKISYDGQHEYIISRYLSPTKKPGMDIVYIIESEDYYNMGLIPINKEVYYVSKKILANIFN